MVVRNAPLLNKTLLHNTRVSALTETYAHTALMSRCRICSRVQSEPACGKGPQRDRGLLQHRRRLGISAMLATIQGPYLYSRHVNRVPPVELGLPRGLRRAWDDPAAAQAHDLRNVSGAA